MTVATHPDAIQNWRAAVRDIATRLVRPRTRLGLVRWAERHRVLDESNAISGPYRIRRTPALQEIADALDNPRGGTVVVVKPARMGATELLINTRIGQLIDENPGPILVIWPTREDAQEWSKDTLPSLLQTKVLRQRVYDGGPKDSNNTILYKRFTGGSLIAFGSNSARQFRRRKGKHLMVDELDVCDASNKEGDVVARMIRRADSYPDATILLTGSPTRITVDPDGTIKGSRIWREFLDTNQQYLHVPCPHCGAYQRLVLANFHWEKGPGTGAQRHRFESAHFRCIACGERIEEQHKPAMLYRRQWIASNPSHKRQGFCLGGFISLFPGAKWAVLAAQYYAATKDQSKMEEFVNQVLGEPYQDRSASESTDLTARRESFVADVPMGACVLTAGVDKQGDRLEVLISAWGPGFEQWQVEHHRVFGDTSDPTDECWKALDRILMRPFLHESGATLYLACALVDSGDDATTVYQYTTPRQGRKIYAAKGDSKGDRSFVVKPGKAGTGATRLFIFSPNKCKDVLFRRLRIPLPGPGYVHVGMPQADGLDEEYLAQFGAEREEWVKGRDGRKRLTYVQIGNRANEAIDCSNLAFAALHVLGAGVLNFLPQLLTQVHERGRAAGGLESARARLEATKANPPSRAATSRRIISRGVED